VNDSSHFAFRTFGVILFEQPLRQIMKSRIERIFGCRNFATFCPQLRVGKYFVTRGEQLWRDLAQRAGRQSMFGKIGSARVVGDRRSSHRVLSK
jgi:hypothetical protein